MAYCSAKYWHIKGNILSEVLDMNVWSVAILKTSTSDLFFQPVANIVSCYSCGSFVWTKWQSLPKLTALIVCPCHLVKWLIWSLWTQKGEFGLRTFWCLRLGQVLAGIMGYKIGFNAICVNYFYMCNLQYVSLFWAPFHICDNIIHVNIVSCVLDYFSIRQLFHLNINTSHDIG